MAAAASPTQTTEKRHCGARGRQTGKPCARPAGWGTDHVGFGECKLHGGSTRSGKIRATKLRVAAELAAAAAAANQPLVDRRPIGGREAIEKALAGTNGIVDALRSEADRLTEKSVVSGSELHTVIRLSQQAERELAHIGKLAADAGIDERRVRMEEEQAEELAAIFRLVFERLGLTAEQAERAPQVVEETIREFEVIQGGRAA